MDRLKNWNPALVIILAEVGGALYTAGYTASTLYTVNPASGALNAVGSSIIFFALGSTTTGLYAAGWPAGTSTSGPTYLYSINPRTAAATQIGQFGPGIRPCISPIRVPVLFLSR
jgi:hypothetical protein